MNDEQTSRTDDTPNQPWMHERVFGGRLIMNKTTFFGLFYWYDVFICMVPDAIVDCLGDIIPRLSSTWGPGAYAEMRRHLYNGRGSVLSFTIHQIVARIFGVQIMSILIHQALHLITHLAGS